jgi:hypothetical protein
VSDGRWLALKVAFEAFADPALWRAYQQAPPSPSAAPSPWLGRHAQRPFLQTGSPQRDPFRFDQRIRAPERQGISRERAWNALLADFKSRLLSGELMATGVEGTDSLSYIRKPIPRELWHRLRLQIRTSRATLGTLTVLDIEVRRVQANQVAEAEIPSVIPPSSETKRPGRRGRPSIKDRLAQEMRRRAEAGELVDGVAAEARALRSWAEQNIQGAKIPQVDSIEDAIRDLYWDLRRGKK